MPPSNRVKDLLRKHCDNTPVAAAPTDLKERQDVWRRIRETAGVKATVVTTAVDRHGKDVTNPDAWISHTEEIDVLIEAALIRVDLTSEETASRHRLKSLEELESLGLCRNNPVPVPIGIQNLVRQRGVVVVDAAERYSVASTFASAISILMG